MARPKKDIETKPMFDAGDRVRMKGRPGEMVVLVPNSLKGRLVACCRPDGRRVYLDASLLERVIHGPAPERH